MAGKVQTPPAQASSAAISSASGPSRISSSLYSVIASSRERTSLLANPFYEDNGILNLLAQLMFYQNILYLEWAFDDLNISFFCPLEHG